MNKLITAEDRQIIGDFLDNIFKDELWAGMKRLEEFNAHLIDDDSLLELCKGSEKEDPITQMNLFSMYYEWKANYLPPTDKSQAEIDRAASLYDKYKHTLFKDLIKSAKHQYRKK